MSLHKAIGDIAQRAQGIAEELHVERKRRLALETENEDLKHKLRTVELTLQGSAPLDALDVLQYTPTHRRTH